MIHLTQDQRYTISVMKELGYCQKDIVKAIKKDKSTVSRELRRNCDQRSGKYNSDLVQRKHNLRQKSKPRAIKFTEEVKNHVDLMLSDKWSQEQISNTPEPNGLTLVSHEQIYQYIIEDKKKGGINISI